MSDATYSIYLHVFPNEKMYVGITSKNPVERWGRNGNGYHQQTLVMNAIKKYGWENVEHHVLLDGMTKEEAEFLETEMIEAYGTTDRRFGYNLQIGGGLHGLHSEESKKKMSVSRLGKKPTMETREKRSLAMKGRQFSAEAKAKMRSAKANKIRSVQCVETGETFEAMIDAAKKLGVHVGSISRVMDNPNRVANGYHFITPNNNKKEAI